MTGKLPLCPQAPPDCPDVTEPGFDPETDSEGILAEANTVAEVDRPPDAPAPRSVGFADILGPEPTWHRCDCGAMCSRVPCWDCDQAALERADAARAIHDAGLSIPRRYDWATVDAPELVARAKVAGPLADIIERVLGATRVVFYGSAATGKTSLATACLRKRLPKGMFVSSLRLGTARIQHAAGGGEAPLVQRAMRAKLLLLDDFGQEGQTSTNAVRDIIFERHDLDLPTWITTAFKTSELAKFYGDGVARRISEGAYVVSMGGGSK